jgi:hypothetical protein
MKNTHRHPYDTEHVQEKLLLYSIKMENACLYKVFSISLWLFSSLLIYFLTPHLTTKMRSEKSLLLEGLIECFPPGPTTLFNYIKWLSSPASGFRSQPLHTLNAYLIYSLCKGMASMAH